MRYQVKEACFGFQGHYWEKGQIVDLPEGSKPPIHFQALDEKKGEVQKSEDESLPIVEQTPLEEPKDEHSEGAPAPKSPEKSRKSSKKPPATT